MFDSACTTVVTERDAFEIHERLTRVEVVAMLMDEFEDQVPEYTMSQEVCVDYHLFTSEDGPVPLTEIFACLFDSLDE